MHQIIKLQDLPYARAVSLDIPRFTISRFVGMIRQFSYHHPSHQMRDLCHQLLLSEVMVFDGRIKYVNNSIWNDDVLWVPFLRSISFIGHQPGPAFEEADAVGISSFGNIQSSGNAWEVKQEIHMYVPDPQYPVPAEDTRIAGEWRASLRKQPTVEVREFGGLTERAPIVDIANSWLLHPKTYGLRNAFLQLCLWALHEQWDGRRTYRVTAEDGSTALIGYVPAPDGAPVDWVFHTYWQESGETRLGTAALAATLPKLDGPVMITCASEIGESSYQEFERYKRKFSTAKFELYAEMACPFDVAPPFFHTGRKEVVK